MDEVADSITTLGNVVKLEYDLEHSDFLMHYGKGHDDNPPGRGSGRYPYGSGKRPMQDVRSKEDRLAAMRMRAVEKAFNESSKKDEDYGKILQKALDEASKRDPDLFKNKHEDTMDAHLMWLFDEYKKALPKKQVFVSGSSHTQTENDPYYRKELPKAIRDELDKLVADSSGIIVGDAPGIDRQVQDYLKTLNYENVSVYGPGKKLRYLANENWTARPIDAPEFEPGSPEWLAKKDIAMEKDATEGLAVILDEGAKATRNNIKRLQNDGKEVKVYELNKVSEELDHWVDNLLDEVKHIDEGGDYLEHYGKGHDDNPPGRGSGRYAFGSGERPFQRDPARRKLAGSSGNIVRRPKTGGLFSILSKRAKEHSDAAQAKEQERQIKEAQAKAEAAKKKRLEALAKAREVRKANIDKAAAEKAAKEAEEKRINDAIESGDPDKISKIMSKLSNEQQRDAITRINQTAQINSLAAQQRKAIADAEAARKAAEEAIKEANRPRTKAEIREQKFNEALAKVSKAADKLDKVRDSGEKFIKFYNLAAGVNNAFNDKLKLPKIDLGGGQKKDGDKNKDENKDKKDKQQNQNNGGNNQNKDKQQNQSNGDTYNTTRDSYNTYNTYNDYRWTAFTEEFFRAYNAQPNRQTWEAYQEQGNRLLEDFSKRKK